MKGTLIANQALRTPRSEFFDSIMVPSGMNVADRRIVELVQSGDLVVTADIPLAAEVVANGAQALDPRGELYTEANVGERLAVRNLFDELRGGGPITGQPTIKLVRERLPLLGREVRWSAILPPLEDRRLHLSPETPVRALDDLPAEQIPEDIHRLYEQAIAARPELHAQLADVMRQQRNVDLARLDYLPDIRLSGMWMGMGMVMPNHGMNGPPDTGNAFMLGGGVSNCRQLSTCCRKVTSPTS